MGETCVTGCTYCWSSPFTGENNSKGKDIGAFQKTEGGQLKHARREPF